MCRILLIFQAGKLEMEKGRKIKFMKLGAYITVNIIIYSCC